MKQENKFFSVDFEIKESDNENEKWITTLSGIANKIGVIDSYDDETIKGCFSETIKNSPVVPALFNHKSDEIVGITKLSENKEGDLISDIEIDTRNEKGKDLVNLIKQFKDAGRPMQLSIGFRPQKFSFYESEKATFGVIRKLEKVDVKEVSIVPFAANEESEITAIKNRNENYLNKEKNKNKNVINRLIFKSNSLGGKNE